MSEKLNTYLVFELYVWVIDRQQNKTNVLQLQKNIQKWIYNLIQVCFLFVFYLFIFYSQHTFIQQLFC